MVASFVVRDDGGLGVFGTTQHPDSGVFPVNDGVKGLTKGDPGSFFFTSEHTCILEGSITL